METFKSPLDLYNDINTFTFKNGDEGRIYLTHRDNPFFNNYKWENGVDLDQIAKDNDLDNDYSMADRRADFWGNDINKYKVDYDTMLKSYRDSPVRVKFSNGKYQIQDGHHRIKALRNMGYTKAPMYVMRGQ